MSDLYICPHCGEPAKSKSGLERHCKVKHPQDAIFFCPDCTTVAKSEAGLKRHRESQHGVAKSK